ncbi:hypothetical protein CYMTET_24303 [Cymbomonas tetramitiformis]|uniref:Uncharacterized protein n=1 Tax=Cymbomonas tetramitiformis TaxID=36881 RepID=A0AAE0FX04_9CHLO|nr:hypothetical protein CYMTET_24303 [Cymbomonas tetramitiformis]
MFMKPFLLENDSLTISYALLLVFAACSAPNTIEQDSTELVANETQEHHKKQRTPQDTTVVNDAAIRLKRLAASGHAAKDLAAKDAVAAKKEIARVERAERAASAKEKAAHKEAQKREELSSGDSTTLLIVLWLRKNLISLLGCHKVT